MSRKLVLLFLSIVYFSHLSGQISGVVTDVDGETLPYVNIFIEGTTSGTASNIDGEYNILAAVGETIIFRYIGYQDIKVKVEKPVQELPVMMERQSVSLQEVVIAADAEDPAYAIIRAAIKKRNYYKNQVEQYSAQTYAKGVVRMLETPEKIFGEEIGDMEGVLDTTGQGIIYLSESQSTVYFMAPDNIKEIMTSSKVSGSDGSFNINRLTNAQYDIYEEYFVFTRTVINPLADNALSYYKYKLEGATLDDDGRLVNKIAVIPKSPNRPVFSGHIYIADDLWNVRQLDLQMTGKAMKEPIFDTIVFKQQFLPVGKEDIWRLFSQEMSFTAGGFGFKVGGTFSYIFSDYDVAPGLSADFFGNEDFRMEETALRTDSSFWEEVRPIPLTDEEKKDYIKKDSLSALWNSKEWQDSVDRVNNKFSIGDFLFGYNYSQTHKRRNLGISSPIGVYRFNTVEGHAIGTNIKYSTWDSLSQRRLEVGTTVGYGFSDKQLKIDGTVRYRSDRIHQEYFTLRGGDTYKQFDNANPVSPFINTWSGLFYKENTIRLYRSQYADFTYQREIANGVYLWATVGYERRQSVATNSDFSLFSRDDVYQRNNPELSFTEDLVFDPNTAATLKVDVRWRPGQTYATYPHYRIRQPSGLPTFTLQYKRAFVGLGDADYDRLKLTIYDSKIRIKEYGYSKLRASAGTFLRVAANTSYIDMHHFFTNENSIINLDRYMETFRLMLHYSYSSINDYASLHYEHHFDGYIMDKIPVLKDLGAKLVLSANTLQMVDRPAYYEASVGIDQLKISLFSVFRMDYTWAFSDGGLVDQGFFLGISTTIGG